MTLSLERETTKTSANVISIVKRLLEPPPLDSTQNELHAGSNGYGFWLNSDELRIVELLATNAPRHYHTAVNTVDLDGSLGYGLCFGRIDYRTNQVTASSFYGIPAPSDWVTLTYHSPIAVYNAQMAEEPPCPTGQTSTALLDRIRGFKSLPADWDGDDTVLVGDQTIAAAATLIDAVNQTELPLPQASPSSEGDIGLNWYIGRDVFEVNISPDMHAFWASLVDNRVEPGKVVEVNSPEFPTPIVEMIREFYRYAAGVPLRE